MHPVVLLLLMIVGTAVAAVPTAYLVGLGTRWVPSRAARVVARLTLVTPIAIVFGVGAPVAFSRLEDEGPWQCLVCTREEDRSAFAGVVYSKRPRPPSEYETWFEREVRRDHAHDW